MLKADQKINEEELIRHCKGKLARYKCPKNIQFWDKLPKTPIGKIIRKAIKRHFWEGKVKSIG